MGSLMAGWSTSPSHPDEAMKRSNSSVTKEEVEKFWRTKKLLMQEHLEEANKDAALSPKMGLAREMTEEIDSQQKLAEGGMSMSLPEGNSRAWYFFKSPSPDRQKELIDEVKPVHMQWTKSKWAFLNDPPTLDLKESKYVPQFEVATLGQLQAEHPAF